VHKNTFSSIFIIFTMLLFIILLSSCSKHVIIGDANAKLLEYTFKYKDSEKLDEILQKQRYTFSKDSTKKIISIIFLNGKQAKIKEYITSNEDILDIIVPPNTDFIISLPIFTTVTYTWNIKNDIEDDTIIFISKSRINFFSSSAKKTDGEGYGRENFYFNASDERTQKLCFRYEHETGIYPEYYDLTINISLK